MPVSQLSMPPQTPDTSLLSTLCLSAQRAHTSKPNVTQLGQPYGFWTAFYARGCATVSNGRFLVVSGTTTAAAAASSSSGAGGGNATTAASIT